MRKGNFGKAVVVVGAFLGMFLSGSVYAGFMAVPLKAELDLAKQVVVGKIVAIAKEGESHEGKMVAGLATVEVAETLKGEPAREVKMHVIMALDGKLSNQMQSPERVYRVGQEGIWVIMSVGRPSHGYGLLPMDQLKEVKAELAALEKRTWSEEVNGVKVWAEVEMNDPGTPRTWGTLMFAVQNVSNKEVYLPRPMYHSVVSAVAEDRKGRKVVLKGLGSGTDAPADGTLYAGEPLKPGETRYMHPDGEDYGSFLIPKEVGPGRYTITVRLKNEADGRFRDRLVTLWKGEVVSPAVTIEIPKER